MIRVKVALDVNIPQRVVRMLQSGFGDQGYEFIWEPQFASAADDDEVWAVAFRRFGGQVVISGDKNIARKPHQILAFQENGLMGFFCARSWMTHDMTFKCAHLLMWWPRMQRQLATAKPRDFWWVPMGLRDAPFKKVELPSHVGKTKKAK